jgi:long-chain acyl-CoA synthetase
VAEVRVIDAAGKELPRGTPGEIVASSLTAMLGYWNRAEETGQTLRGPWVHTGDVGWMDDEGFVFIVDRMKDMIVSGGENVYSAEVENALCRHPEVAMCAVIGVPSERWGESVHAVVVARPGTNPSEADLVAHCKAVIASYKCPRSIEFQPALPMSAAGKVLKHRLREPHWAGQARRVS